MTELDELFDLKRSGRLEFWLFMAERSDVIGLTMAIVEALEQAMLTQKCASLMLDDLTARAAA